MLQRHLGKNAARGRKQHKLLTAGDLEMAAAARAAHMLQPLSMVEKRGVGKKVSRLGRSQMAAAMGKQMADVKHPAHLRAPSPLVLWLHGRTWEPGSIELPGP